MFEPTEFAPAERASSEALARQTALFQGSLVAIALNAIPAGVIITNTHRQIVFGNPVFASLTGSSQTELLGLRPGEALSCSNATLSSGGCGTTQFCRHCGAAQAILQSLSGEPAVNECHLIRKDIAQDASLDMQIFTSPFTHAGETFTLLTALDVSHERRIKAIESYYFTDVLADVGNIRNLAEMLETEVQPELWEYCQHLRFVSKRLLEGMAAYRDLGEVEQGNFQPSPEVITSRETIESVAQLFRAHAAAEGKQVRLDPECPPGVRLT
ncbi:MAG: histidine kinase, partial [Proteobacteria bacterium]|nr:histidine kinase [Pseudomonadota bacterium]MBU1610482.1 histidine kinase [Pseudomonadota bacterium]